MTQSSFATTGGDGEASYSRNSHFQKGLSACLQPSLEDTLLHHFSPPQGDGPIHYADFGCAVGANTLAYAEFAVETLKKKPEMAGRDFLCYFADLPSNDFNTLFNQFPQIVGQGGGDRSVEERTWFAAGVPGSQYGRMFPRSSLHVAISALTLHYLSEIPKSISDKSSPAYNKGCISAHGASPAAAEAYAEASRKGLREFFECRAEELAPGGILAFFFPGRQDRAHPEKLWYENISVHFIPDLQKAWRELVNEGIIDEELLDTFNAPIFLPSRDELQEAIEHASAFHIQKLEFIEKFEFISEDAKETIFKDVESFGKFQTTLMRAGLGSMASSHIGPELTDILLDRYRHVCEKQYAIQKAAHFPTFIDLCVAVLIRK